MSVAGARRSSADEKPVVLEVSVVPRASRDEVTVGAGGAVRVRLTAPPVENRANEALVRVLAGTLGVPRSRVEILAGGRGRRKLVRVHGLPRRELFRSLGLEEPPD